MKPAATDDVIFMKMNVALEMFSSELNIQILVLSSRSMTAFTETPAANWSKSFRQAAPRPAAACHSSLSSRPSRRCKKYKKTLLIKVSMSSHLTHLTHLFWGTQSPPAGDVCCGCWMFRLYIILSTLRTFHQWHKKHCYSPLRAVLSLALPRVQRRGQSLDTKHRYCNIQRILHPHDGSFHMSRLTELHPSLEQARERTLTGDRQG